jgi:threonine 3-dehydrogenase
MGDTMWALTYDKGRGPWQSTQGLWTAEVSRPILDESKDYRDRSSVLVKTLYAGFCGSDRGIWFRRAFGDMIERSLEREHQAVRVIGHELLGRVVAVGADAQRTHGIEPGDTVSTESHIVCGVCYQCRIGEYHVCADDKILGISENGCFAEYVKLPAKAIWRTDTKKIRPEVSAIQEPFGNAVHACTKVNLRGKRVAVVGCGTIGLFAVAVAKAMGAHVILGVEPLANHAEMARKLGADVVLTPRNTGAAEFAHDAALTAEIRRMTDGVGVDVALEMTGQNSSVNNAIASVRRGGAVILFGLKTGDAVIENFDRLIVDGISLHSVIGRRIFESWHITRHLLESREPNIEQLVWDVILQQGRGTIVPYQSFSERDFEERIRTYPKVLLKFE